jgi:hypothetical protein
MEDEVYFVDTRNADPRVPARATTVVRAPVVHSAPMVHSAPTATRVTYSPPPAQTVIYPAQYGPQLSSPWWGQGSTYSPGPIYAQPPWTSQLGGFLGGMGLGDVIKLAADAFAAFKSLPAPPAPTSDVATDVANSVVYLAALAKDATDRKKFEYAGELASGLTGRLGLGYWGLGGR